MSLRRWVTPALVAGVLSVQPGLAAGAGATSASAPAAAAPASGDGNVRDFGAAGDGKHDDTAAIQAAINAASHAARRRVYFPAGRYSYSTVRAYHDPVLNPGFNPSAGGELLIEGDGMPPELGFAGGTVLVTTVPTGNGFVINPASRDAVPYPSRNVVVRAMGFEGATSGFLVESAGVPGARFIDCEFKQLNAAGSGLYVSTAYFGAVSGCRFTNRAPKPTGDAIRMTSSISGGLFKLTDCNISGFATGFHYAGGPWQNLSIVSSEVVGRRYGVLVDAGTIDQLTLIDSYWEGTGESFVAEAPGPPRIKNLVALSTWAYGPGLSGPAFKLNSPDSLLFEGIYGQDLNTTFLDVAAAPAGGQGSYVVNGATFTRSKPASAPVTLFTGVVPQLNGVTFPTGNPQVALYPSSARPAESRLQLRGVSQLSAGRINVTHLKKYTGVGADIFHNAQGLQGAVDITNTRPMAFLLADASAGLPQGFSVYVKNNASSASAVTVRAQSASRAIAVLQPGQAQWFFFDRDGSGEWF